MPAKRGSLLKGDIKKVQQAKRGSLLKGDIKKVQQEGSYMLAGSFPVVEVFAGA